MYRVVLVDDEPWTLRGIRETFEWKRYGFEVIGCYTSALQAMKEILSKNPDVVFTDIRMPCVTGIELMNTLRKEEIKAEIVVISGYSEFEYALEAIKNGAFDYCLKPINEEITTSLLSRLKRRLDEKREIRIRDIIENGKINPAEANNIFGFHRGYRYYQVLVSNDATDFSFSDILNQYDNLDYAEFRMSRNIYAVVNSDIDLYSSLMKVPVDRTIGVSSVHDSIRSLLSLIEEASIAASTSFITGKKGIYEYKPSNSQALNFFVKRAISLLNDQNFTEYQKMIESIPDIFMKSEFTTEDLCYIWNQLIMHFELTSPKILQDSELTTLEWHQLAARFDGIKDFCQCLLRNNIYNYGAEGEDDCSSDDKSSFNKMLAYINQNYDQPIRLKDLSQMFYINKNYACFLFRKYTGLTFSEYINKLRMEKACELLANTSLSISEVAEKSGYPDYFYFSKLFKKVYGITPTDFRKEPIIVKK